MSPNAAIATPRSSPMRQKSLTNDTACSAHPVAGVDPERAVLGAMLLNPVAAKIAITMLGAAQTCFIGQDTACIFRALVSLHRANIPLDMVTLTDELEKSGSLARAGGASGIAELTDAVPTSANVEHYARIVRENFKRREITAACDAFRNDGDLGEFKRKTCKILEVPDGKEQLTLTDMTNWKNLANEAIPSVFHEGLPLKTFGLLAGDGGTGKSFLALELALSVAFQRPLITGFTPTSDATGPVLCCFAEDDSHVVSSRLKSVCVAMGVSLGEVDELIQNRQLEFIAGYSEPLLTSDGAGGYVHSAAFENLERRVNDREYSLVVVDPLISWAGVSDENNNSAMQQVALALIGLAKASGGAVLCCHHTNKSGSRSADMSQNLSRGGSSLQSAARWICTMRILGEKEAERFDLSSEDVSDYVEIAIAKNSYAEQLAGRSYLHRERGGALRSVNLREARKVRVSGIIADLLSSSEAHLTRREISRGTNEKAKALRTELKKRCSGITGR